MDNIINEVAASADNIADNDIISRILAGEKDLYAILVRRYNQRLYRIAMSMINNDPDTEEVMQVAYIKAFENLRKFESRSAFSTWLTRILINECLLYLRKRKRSLFMNNELIENEMHWRSSEDVQTPLMNVLNSEMKKILEDAICSLPEKYKAVFVMRELENMSVAETQESLNLSEANVKVRLNRAKALLKNSLSPIYKKEDLFSFHLSRCDRLTDNVMREIAGIPFA